MPTAAPFGPRVAGRRCEHRLRGRHNEPATTPIGLPEPSDEADVALVCPAADIDLEDMP